MEIEFKTSPNKIDFDLLINLSWFFMSKLRELIDSPDFFKRGKRPRYK